MCPGTNASRQLAQTGRFFRSTSLSVSMLESASDFSTNLCKNSCLAELLNTSVTDSGSTPFSNGEQVAPTDVLKIPDPWERQFHPFQSRDVCSRWREAAFRAAFFSLLHVDGDFFLGLNINTRSRSLGLGPGQ